MSISKALRLGSIIAVTYVFQSTSALAFSQPGVVQAGFWDNVTGLSVDSLIVLDTYPGTPDQVIELTELRSPQNRGDNYGSLVRGYIVPPSNGSYTFFVAGDDQTEFWLSTSENPSAANLTASVTGWTRPDEYAKYGSQSSSIQELSAGQRYYFEIRHKEGSGGDHFSVAWEGPGITQQVIGSSFIASLAQSGTTTSPDQEAIRKAYSQGYRVGFLDGSEGLGFNSTYPMLDEDQDGIYDNWEIVHGLDPASSGDAGSDRDNDMLTSLDEFLLGTSPTNSDTDGDGIPDGVEFAYELDPLDSSDAGQDMDSDGFSNLEEYQANTDPSDSAEAPVTETSQLYGFIGEYFDGTDFNRFVLSRQDANIDFSWGVGQPMAELPADNFSVRWNGMFTAPHSSGIEEYEFTTFTDDGVRLYLNGNLVINQWKDQGSTAYSHTIKLGAQETIAVTKEYYERGGAARAQLSITRIATGEKVSTRETVTVPGTAEPVITEPDPQSEPLQAPGEATVSWTAPLQRMDGSSLSLAEIDHFEIRYGQDPNNQDMSITAPSDATSIKIADLAAGTWYFSIRVIDTDGLQSVFSEPVEHIIQ